MSTKTVTAGPAVRATRARHRRPAAIAAGDSSTYDPEIVAQYCAERARRALVIDSIRAHLAEQPSPHAVRAAARRWCADITSLADDLVTAMNSTENEE